MSEPQPATKRLIFEPTINPGNVLTAITMLGAGAAVSAEQALRAALRESMRLDPPPKPPAPPAHQRD
jgi:hypothetical protein